MSKSTKPLGFDNFDRLMKGLIRVPMLDLDVAERKYQAAKKCRKSRRKHN